MKKTSFLLVFLLPVLFAGNTMTTNTVSRENNKHISQLNRKAIKKGSDSTFGGDDDDDDNRGITIGGGNGDNSGNTPGHVDFGQPGWGEKIDPFVGKIGRVPQKYLRVGPNGEAPTLSAVGTGIDLTRCGLYAYDSAEMQFDIFDRNWLNSYYANGVYKASNGSSTIDFAMTSTIEAIENSFEFDQSTEAFAQASYSFYKASVAGKVGFSTSNKLHMRETSLIYNLKACSYAFNYEIPQLSTNKNTYLQHLNEEYLNDLSNAINNSYIGHEAFYSLFQKYGTHVLWKAGFGGACEILYSAHSKELNISASVINQVSASLKGSCADAQAGVENNFSLATSMNVSQSSVSENIRGEFVGGKPGAAGVGVTFKEIADRANIWSQDLTDYPAVLSFKIVHPIWELLPTQYSNYKTTMENAYYSYAQFYHDYYDSKSQGLICTEGSLDDTKIELGDGQEVRVGDYWDKKVRHTFEMEFTGDDYYDIQKLKQLGFKNVLVHPTFDLKRTRKGTTVSVFTKVGETKHELKYPINLSDDNVYSYTGTELDFFIGMDDFISNPKMDMKFETNDRGAAFLHWDERGAAITNLVFHITYTKN